MMLADNIGFLLTQYKKTNAREEHRVGVDLLDTEAGCWISSVGSSQSRVQDSTKGFLVSRDPSKKRRKISRN